MVIYWGFLGRLGVSLTLMLLGLLLWISSLILCLSWGCLWDGVILIGIMLGVRRSILGQRWGRKRWVRKRNFNLILFWMQLHYTISSRKKWDHLSTWSIIMNHKAKSVSMGARPRHPCRRVWGQVNNPKKRKRKLKTLQRCKGKRWVARWIRKRWRKKYCA